MVFCIFNDDGFKSEYTQLLITHLNSQGHTVYSFLPNCNKSGASRSISIYKKIKIEKINEKNYIIYGTPTDCVIFAVNYLKEKNIKIDFSLVGINKGLNIGQAKKYSGTISAALESVSYDIPTLAISSAVPYYKCDHSRMFDILDKVILYVYRQIEYKSIVGLNLNFLNFNSKEIVSEHKCVDYENKLYEIVKGSKFFEIVLSKHVKKLPENIFLLLDILKTSKEFEFEKLISYLEDK